MKVPKDQQELIVRTDKILCSLRGAQVLNFLLVRFSLV
jgi:hypothetical protein